MILALAIAGLFVLPDPWRIAQEFPGALAELMASAGLGEPTPIEDPLGNTADEGSNAE